MNLKQITTCLSIGMMAFGMADNAFATAPAEEVANALQGPAVTDYAISDIANPLSKRSKLM